MKKRFILTVFFIFFLGLAFLYIVGLRTTEKTLAPSTALSSTPPKIESIMVACANFICASLSCSVEYSEAPTMEIFAKKVAQLCEKNYPKIKQILPNDSLGQPYRFVIKKNQSNPGITRGSIVYLNSEWFTAHPTDDFGAVIHEMAHVFQAYPPGQPFWLVEGIADYIRYALGYQNAWSYAHCGIHSEHYTSGYWCSAAFLQYVARLYDKEIVSKLNAELKKGAYSDAFFKGHTGKTLEELWQECKTTDCKEK